MGGSEGLGGNGGGDGFGDGGGGGEGGAGGGGSMGHSRWRALRGYLIWSQKRLRTAAARKPGTRQMISSTGLNPAEAAVCKSREDPTAVRHGRPGPVCHAPSLTALRA